jgi:hypothetical protein
VSVKLSLLVLVLLATAATPAAAQGPPFGPVSPADGATVSPDPDGIPVILTCPLYEANCANRRVSGRAELSVGACTGSISFSARRSG